MFGDEENVTEDVHSLRKRLILTELSLKSVSDKLSQSGDHDSLPSVQSSSSVLLPGRLTLEDLRSSELPQSQSSSSCQERLFSPPAGRLKIPPPSNSKTLCSPPRPWQPASLKAGSVKMQSAPIRKKPGGLRQENACLSMRNKQLLSDLDAAHHELATSKSKVRLLGSKVGAKSMGATNVVFMSEQILRLETELEAQVKELRAEELRAERQQQAAAQSASRLAELTEELTALRAELESRTTLGKRTEQQRNQALRNAEKLQEAYKEYKATVSIKLKKVMDNENRLTEKLIVCESEKEELAFQCAALERAMAQQGQIVCQLKEDLRHTKSLTADCAVLQARLEEAGRQTSQIQKELTEWEVRGRELEDLRALTQSQEQRVAQSHREAQRSQAELASLEAMLQLLHLREGPEGPLCVRPCMMPPVECSGTENRLKPKPGECYQQLLPVIQSVEAERARQSGLTQRLQERLSRAQEEISALQSSMDQRASHYQRLHTELLEKADRATDTERELRKKSARAAGLEKQLQEKTSAYTQAVSKNEELEKQLLEKTNSLQHYKSLLTKKQREQQQALEKYKTSQTQQSLELQHQTEVLQVSMEEAQCRALQLEQEFILAQRDRDDAQKATAALQASLKQLEQAKEAESRRSEEALQHFNEQAANSAKMASELETSLSACREELSRHLWQMKEVKESYEAELQQKTDKICASLGLLTSLQDKLQSTNAVCQSSGEQNLQLQRSLQAQQTMLSEGTARIAELEESQSLLQRQVSGLERELERARASLEVELRNRETEARVHEKEVQERSQEATQLSASVSHLTMEMTKCRSELSSMESELQRLRREAGARTSQIKVMEHSLQQAQSLLHKRNDLVVDLEEKLHRSEEDRRGSSQRVQMLEGQLQAVRGELSDTLVSLQELRDVLQKSQATADERKASLDKLSVELRETQKELEERTHEVLHMDTALKERKGELQQRAKLLSQMDVAIRDHKQEMERRVEALQQTLETREAELKEVQRELNDRDRKNSEELHVCGEKLQSTAQELRESQSRCLSLGMELEAARQQTEDMEIHLHLMEEELASNKESWLQSESHLQSKVMCLQQKLELERGRHSKEVESLQQTRGQLLKVSEQISSRMQSSQEQLSAKVQQSQSQLDQAKANYDQVRAQASQLQSQLDKATAQLELANTVLEQNGAEVRRLQMELDQSQAQLHQTTTQLDQTKALCDQTRVENGHLQAKLDQRQDQLHLTAAQLDQARTLCDQTRVENSDLQVQLNHARAQTVQLQTKFQDTEKGLEIANETLLIKESEFTRLQTRMSSLERSSEHHHPITHPPPLHPETHSPALSPPPSQRRSPAGDCMRLPRSPDHSGPRPSCDWLRTASPDLSLGLPQALRATLMEALSQQPWESSSPSISPLPEVVNSSWQGLSALELTSGPDLSFNPLTYMVDGEKENEETEAGRVPQQAGKEGSEPWRLQEESEVDLDSLTGMMRFVSQTLAKQEDTSLWDSTVQPES